MISSSTDKTVRIWESGTGDCTGILNLGVENIVSMVLLPDNNLAMGKEFIFPTTISCWDIKLPHCETNSIAMKLTGNTLTPTPGGLLASCSPNNAVKVWTARPKGAWVMLHPPFHSSSAIEHFVMLPNGCLAIAYEDSYRPVEIWDFYHPANIRPRPEVCRVGALRK